MLFNFCFFLTKVLVSRSHHQNQWGSK